MITCDIHKELMVEFYIKTVNKMICSKCLFKDYQDQMESSLPVESERLYSYVIAALR